MRVTPLAGLTKRIRVMGMRDETRPGTSKGKGSEGHARNSALCAPEGAREMGTETENEETANCLGTEGGGEKIRVSIGNGHLGRESEAGRAASERRTAKAKARAERG